VRDLSCGDKRVFLDVEIRRVACTRCKAVKTETLQWIAKNPFYTKRFGFYVGRRCREASIKSVADELRLDWKTVKELEKEYMAEQLRRAPKPKPNVIGVDEISVRKGHTYRIIVSDLERGVPIWFGGEDRSEKSMAMFYEWLEPARCKHIRLAVMDMWPPFRTALEKHAPEAKVLYDKFHVLRHLGDALDKVRRSEYRRVQGKERSYIKGQRFTLLAHRENLKLDARQALDKLLAANERLNTAYVLKESFGQLWDYKSEAWARKFFNNWRDALRWKRIEPFEKFAWMIEDHWDGIAEYCNSKEKVSLGFVEGLNNKIRSIQRRAFGLRDEEYLRLKVLTCMLPKI